MTETDIEKRLEAYIKQSAVPGKAYGLMTLGELVGEGVALACDAADELRRRAQRISELEYRERSRECVEARNPDTLRYGNKRSVKRAESVSVAAIETTNCTNLGDLPPDRPDAVQILRERGAELLSPTNREYPNHWDTTLIASALREVADALERERKG